MKQTHTNKNGIFYDPLINDGFFNDRHMELIRATAPDADIVVVKDLNKKMTNYQPNVLISRFFRNKH